MGNQIIFKGGSIMELNDIHNSIIETKGIKEVATLSEYSALMRVIYEDGSNRTYTYGSNVELRNQDCIRIWDAKKLNESKE